jgi:hypothetical protein
MNEILMRALLQAVAFFELASDEVLDPDAAVAALEDIAYLLRQLSAAEKETLIAFVRAEGRGGRESPAYRDFLRDFPEAMLGTA